ncbi:hypothetical protein KIPB_011308, partial [Kipferlia bialata]
VLQRDGPRRVPSLSGGSVWDSGAESDGTIVCPCAKEHLMVLRIQCMMGGFLMAVVVSLIFVDGADFTVFPIEEVSCAASQIVTHMDFVRGLISRKTERVILVAMYLGLLLTIAVLSLWFSYPLQRQYGPLLLVACALVTTNMWRWNWAERVVLQRQAAKMNRSKRAAIYVFHSSLPVGTRRYVTQPSLLTSVYSPVETDTTLTETGGGGETLAVGPESEAEVEAEAEAEAEAERERDIDDVDSVSVSVGRDHEEEEEGKEREGQDGKTVAEESPAAPAPVLDAQEVEVGVPAQSLALADIGPGMITTEENVVIGFLGVVPTEEAIPAAAYIQNLITLMHVIDGLLMLSYTGVEKIKGSDGVLIVRVCGPSLSQAPQTEEEREQAEWEQVTRDCRLMCRFLSAVSIAANHMIGRTLNGDIIQGLRAGVACGPVTAGVLGTCELMYDVFGDTVNTAARLMSKAGAGEILVSEMVAAHVASVAMPPDGTARPQERCGHLGLVQSRPRLLFLKGKGLFPVRQVLLTKTSLHRTHRHLM